MKRMIMLIVVLIFLVGCTSKVTEPIFIEADKYEFISIDVNVTEVEKPPALKLDGKLHFEDDANESIVMSVDTWLNIRKISKAKTHVIKRLRTHILMYSKALESVNRQIRKYRVFNLKNSD